MMMIRTATTEPSLLHGDGLFFYSASIRNASRGHDFQCGTSPRCYMKLQGCDLIDSVFVVFFTPKFLDRQDESSAADCRSRN